MEFFDLSTLAYFGLFALGVGVVYLPFLLGQRVVGRIAVVVALGVGFVALMLVSMQSADLTPAMFTWVLLVAVVPLAALVWKGNGSGPGKRR